MTAADVYAATAMGLFRPLAARALRDGRGDARRVRDAATRRDAALDPVLLAHRDMMYAKHLALPLSL